MCWHDLETCGNNHTSLKGWCADQIRSNVSSQHRAWHISTSQMFAFSSIFSHWSFNWISFVVTNRPLCAIEWMFWKVIMWVNKTCIQNVFMLSNVMTAWSKWNQNHWPLKNFSLESLCHQELCCDIRSTPILMVNHSASLSVLFGDSHLYDLLSTQSKYSRVLWEGLDVVLLTKYQNNKSIFHLCLLFTFLFLHP